MADKVYVTAVGMVQKFGDKPAVEQRDANGQTVYGFTIKTASQQYVGITLWPEFAHAAPLIQEGVGVIVEGSYTESTGKTDGRKFHNVSAYRLALVPAIQPAERDVVNPTSEAPAATQAAGPPAGMSF